MFFLILSSHRVRLNSQGFRPCTPNEFDGGFVVEMAVLSGKMQEAVFERTLNEFIPKYSISRENIAFQVKLNTFKKAWCFWNQNEIFQLKRSRITLILS